jgi:hypothetical protein
MLVESSTSDIEMLVFFDIVMAARHCRS